MIPRTLIRTVPAETTEQVEEWWNTACALHPDWDHITLRDPLNPADFPLTAEAWDRCQNGAQFAGLIRLEALLNLGGIYLDSDIEMYRSLEPLRAHGAFGAWEDRQTVPDLVMGATAHHPAIEECLHLALTRIHSDSTDWTTGNGAWSTGPGVTTTVFTKRSDVHLLPPIAFCPVHYSEKQRCAEHPGRDNPACYGMHWWAASWL